MVVTKALGAKYKDDHGTGPVVATPPVDLQPFDLGPLKATAEKKAKKMYQGAVHLLIYINTQGSHANNDQVAGAALEACGGAFESIWLLAYGQESGGRGPISNFVMCAKPSSLLATADGWLRVPGTESSKE